MDWIHQISDKNWKISGKQSQEGYDSIIDKLFVRQVTLGVSNRTPGPYCQLSQDEIWTVR